MSTVGCRGARPMEVAHDRVQCSFLEGTSAVEQTVSATAMVVSSLCME